MMALYKGFFSFCYFICNIIIFYYWSCDWYFFYF
jgi:hypothetical protein